MAQSPTIKISANIPAATLDVLRDSAALRGTTVTEALRRAIELDNFLAAEEHGGSNLLLEKPDKSIVRIIRK